ncbi:MAG TPA: exopolysaccharide biosynthesis protein, partial [Gaiellales bacterium]|nr:exopolysaccharide biosynthesis protein [Gaiellales bacterium]
MAEDPRARSARTEKFSLVLEAWLRGDSDKTVGALTRDFGEKSFAVAVLVLMLVPALPLPTGGISHVFEAITVVVGAEMVAGRETVWLPARWRR